MYGFNVFAAYTDYDLCNALVEGQAWIADANSGYKSYFAQAGVWEIGRVYDWAVSEWKWSNWVHAESGSSWTVHVGNPYMGYAYYWFARYNAGWHYAYETAPVEEGRNNEWCRMMG